MAMARKKSWNDVEKQSSWIDKNFLISLSIFFCTYSILGWSIANIVDDWVNIVNKQSIAIHLLIQQNILLLIIKLFILIITIIISLILSSPLALISFIFEKSINSDLKAFFAILFWSVLLVFIFSSFDYFADLLVITSTNILLRIDLEKSNYKGWQIFFLTLILALGAFSIGVFLFNIFSGD